MRELNFFDWVLIFCGVLGLLTGNAAIVAWCCLMALLFNKPAFEVFVTKQAVQKAVREELDKDEPNR